MQNERGRVRRAASLLRCVRDWLHGADWFGAGIGGWRRSVVGVWWAASGWPGGWVFPFWCGLLLVGGLEGVGGLSARGQSAAHDGQGRQDRDYGTDRTTSGRVLVVQTHGFSPQLSPTGLVPRPRPHPESRRPRGVIRTQGDLQTEADPTTLQVPDGVFAHSESHKYRKRSQHA